MCLRIGCGVPSHMFKYVVMFVMSLHLDRGVPVYIFKDVQGISMLLRLGHGVPRHFRICCNVFDVFTPWSRLSYFYFENISKDFNVFYALVAGFPNMFSNVSQFLMCFRRGRGVPI